MTFFRMEPEDSRLYPAFKEGRFYRDDDADVEFVILSDSARFIDFGHKRPRGVWELRKILKGVEDAH